MRRGTVQVTKIEEEPGDEELLAEIRAGSHRAFAVLVRRHTPRFHRLAWRFTRSAHEAEDVVQDAFLKLWQQPGHFRPEHGARFTTWFSRVITNACLDRAKRKPHLPIPDHAEFTDARPDPQEETLAAERQAALERAIAGLPERQRVAVNLCYGGGLSNEEAAKSMRMGLKALQSLLMRARTTLKEAMTPYG